MKETFYGLFVPIFFFFSTFAFAQDNLIYKGIQDSKYGEMDYQVVSSIFSQSFDDKEILSHFENTEDVHFLQYEYKAVVDLKGAIYFEIPLKTGQLQLELLEVPKSFYNYEVVTSDGKRISSNKDIKHYRGIVKDDPNSLVAISFMEDGGNGHGCYR